MNDRDASNGAVSTGYHSAPNLRGRGPGAPRAAWC
jgi:hypothetical protein